MFIHQHYSIDRHAMLALKIQFLLQNLHFYVIFKEKFAQIYTFNVPTLLCYIGLVYEISVKKCNISNTISLQYKRAPSQKIETNCKRNYDKTLCIDNY